LKEIKKVRLGLLCATGDPFTTICGSPAGGTAVKWTHLLIFGIGYPVKFATMFSVQGALH
jgi:hypothetical protein